MYVLKSTPNEESMISAMTHEEHVHGSVFKHGYTCFLFSIASLQQWHNDTRTTIKGSIHHSVHVNKWSPFIKGDTSHDPSRSHKSYIHPYKHPHHDRPSWSPSSDAPRANSQTKLLSCLCDREQGRVVREPLEAGMNWKNWKSEGLSVHLHSNTSRSPTNPLLLLNLTQHRLSPTRGHPWFAKISLLITQHRARIMKCKGGLVHQCR